MCKLLFFCYFQEKTNLVKLKVRCEESIFDSKHDLHMIEVQELSFQIELGLSQYSFSELLYFFFSKVEFISGGDLCEVMFFLTVFSDLAGNIKSIVQYFL